MKGLNVTLFAGLFLIVMLSAVAAMTAHALTISDNNVGIGTDTPGHPLDVVGNINANSFSGSGAGLTDISGDHITSGTVLESLIDPLICRDSEITSAISTHSSDSSAHHPRYTDAEAVTAIKAVDGTGSGLDADLLDGHHASDFASSTHNHDIFFGKVGGPGYPLAQDIDGYSEVSWDSGISIQLTGPGTYIVDFGARADCESTGGVFTFVKVFPTLDDIPVAGEEAWLGTRTYVYANIAEPAQIAITDSNTHTLGLGAIGATYNIASTGCYLHVVWIKANLMHN